MIPLPDLSRPEDVCCEADVSDEGEDLIFDAVWVPQHGQRGGILHHPAARDAITWKDWQIEL